MDIDAHIPLLDDILSRWRREIGRDYPGYRNHVYRMVHFCFVLHRCTDEERRRIIIAGCFHDLGIWSDRTFDYLPPSVARAKDYLRENGLEQWSPEIALMIDGHHKLRPHKDARFALVEAFRQADLVDVSLGLVTCGIRRRDISRVKAQFPDAGFHWKLVKLLGGWAPRHPARPLPFLRW